VGAIIVELYNVGPDELSSQYDLEYLFNLNPQPVWIAYWYEIGDYCGSGQIIYKDGEDYYAAGISHCSCYGPSDSLPGEKIDIEQWIASNERIRSEVYTNQYDTLLLDKVKELL
jgi:hypothetical protein